MGSSRPSFMASMSGDLADTFHTKQPDVYQSNLAIINSINFIFYIVWAAVVTVTLVAIYLSASAKKNIGKLDLYKNLHNHILGIDMFLTKTTLGGIFSVIFGITVIVIIGTNVTLYLYDNIEESKALVPYIVIENEYPTISDNFQGNRQPAKCFKIGTA